MKKIIPFILLLGLVSCGSPDVDTASDTPVATTAATEAAEESTSAATDAAEEKETKPAAKTTAAAAEEAAGTGTDTGSTDKAASSGRKSSSETTAAAGGSGSGIISETPVMGEDDKSVDIERPGESPDDIPIEEYPTIDLSMFEEDGVIELPEIPIEDLGD